MLSLVLILKLGTLMLYLFIFRECFEMKAETSLGKEKETARR